MLSTLNSGTPAAGFLSSMLPLDRQVQRCRISLTWWSAEAGDRPSVQHRGVERLDLLPGDLVQRCCPNRSLMRSRYSSSSRSPGALARLHVGQVVVVEELVERDHGPAGLRFAARVGAELDLGLQLAAFRPRPASCRPCARASGAGSCRPDLVAQVVRASRLVSRTSRYRPGLRCRSTRSRRMPGGQGSPLAIRSWVNLIVAICFLNFLYIRNTECGGFRHRANKWCVRPADIDHLNESLLALGFPNRHSKAIPECGQRRCLGRPLLMERFWPRRESMALVVKRSSHSFDVRSVRFGLR